MKKLWLSILIVALLFSQVDATVVLLNKVGVSQNHYSGLSTDVMPTPGAAGYGSTFYVEDIGVRYVYGSSGWVIDKTSITGSIIAAIGSSLPAGTNNIGDVDIATLPGTVQADIATLKADTALIKSDIATIKAGIPLNAGETHVGAIGGNTALIAITPTVTAGAYHANDVVGGIQTLTSALRVSGGTAILQNVTVRDLAAQNAVLQIFFFNANPGTGTYTDNAALDLDDTDSGLFIGKVTINAADYISLADNSVATITNCGLALKATTGTSLYAIIRTTGTPTYASTSDLKITFGLLRD